LTKTEPDAFHLVTEVVEGITLRDAINEKKKQQGGKEKEGGLPEGDVR
jgi:hypothetical protein